MKIFEEIEEYYKKYFGKKILVVGTEAESLQIKKAFFSLGARIVSDRDVVTLDYLLTQQLIQKKGMRIIDDFLFPYVENFDSKLLTLDCIDWVKKFPDPFTEPEVFEVLKEYSSEEEGFQPHFKRLEQACSLASKSMQKKLIPRSFIKLGLYSLLEDEHYVFLSTLLNELPFGFQEAFRGEQILSEVVTPEWSKQIDLYRTLKDKNTNVDFKNFSSQCEEVRFVLREMSLKEEDFENILFLYPPNKGYETLFFIYQREFFKEQKFFYQKRGKTFLPEFLKKLRSQVTPLETNYSHEVDNKNHVIFSKKEDRRSSLKNILKGFKGKFTEYDLNLIAPLAHQLDQSVELLISDWVNIFSEIEKKEGKKLKKITTNLPIEDYSSFQTKNLNKIYVMGWGDYLFNKTGEKLFSNSVLHGIERDLGLNLLSLNKSSASDLMKNPSIWSSETEKIFLYSEKTSSGGSVKPGVLKILWDHEKMEVQVDRVQMEEKLDLTRERLSYEENKVSASSLQRYDECPYKFYLDRVLKVNFEEDEDYFLSAKEEGLLIHKALEEVQNKGITKSQFKVLLEELIFTEIEDFNYFRKAPLLNFVEHLWKIIESEQLYLKEKGVSKIEVEKFFSFKAAPDKKKISGSGEGFKVVGVVDRVDSFEDGGGFLYDYKRADTGSILLSRYTGKKLSPQLFLYCIAADEGLLGEFKTFLGFQYINVRSYKRIKGFVDKEQGVKAAKEVSSGAAVLSDKYEEKMNLFLEKFWFVLEKIEKSEFQEKPNPAYSGACLSCDFIGICKKSETFQ